MEQSKDNNMSHAQLSIFGMNSFHNSVPIKDEEELQVREKKSKSMEDHMLRHFRDHPYTSFTPHALWLLCGEQYPLTSIRRAMTNLTKAGHLVVTGEMRPGLYGVNVNCWILKRKGK